MPLHAQSQRVEFKEVSEQIGIDHNYASRRGAGVAFFDYNNDFLEDIVFAHNSKNLLYKNNGDGTFTNVAKEAGVTQVGDVRCIGVITADFNNDGFVDILFSTEKSDPLLILKNNGDGTFRDVSSTSQLYDTKDYRKSKGITVGDVNLDGLLDVYIGHTVSKHDQQFLQGKKDHIEMECYEDQLFLNTGNFIFENVTEAYGVGNRGCGLASVFTDVDNDGDLDLLVANDWGKEVIPSKFYLNQYPEPHFIDVSAPSGFDFPVYGMGVALGDYDKDGDLDYYETNIGRHHLFVNDGSNIFHDKAVEAGVDDIWVDDTKKAYASVGWGTSFTDIDNDSDLDLIVSTGLHLGFARLKDQILPTRESMPSRYFDNVGDGTFIDRAMECGLVDTGNSHSMAIGDYDNDGDQDIIFSRTALSDDQAGRPAIFRNDQELGNNWLKVKLVGTVNNRDAIGTHLYIHIGQQKWVQEINSGGQGQMSQNSRIAHIGLGDAQSVDSVIIDWPGSKTSNQVFYHLESNQMIVITENQNEYEKILCHNQVQDGDEIGIDCGGNYCRPCFCDEVSSQRPVKDCIEKDLCYLASVCHKSEEELKNLSIARLWNEVLLNSIRRDFARPTVHARNLFHSSVAMYDCWAAFEPNAPTYLLGQNLHGFTCDFSSIPTPENVHSAKEVAISYAMYHLIRNRFKDSPGRYQTFKDVDGMFEYLGLDPHFDSKDYSSGNPAALGNYVAEQIINFGYQDGSNQLNHYQSSKYTPVNPPLVMHRRSTELKYPNRWQPLTLKLFIDQAGNVIPGNTPEFIGPEWGNVTPFSLSSTDATIKERDGVELKVYHDPGPPPLLSEDSLSLSYKNGFCLVTIWGSHLDPGDNTKIDISPNRIGNNPSIPRSSSDNLSFYNLLEGGDKSTGYSVNPISKKPYEQQIVKRGDYTRVLAEFWADGPDSETPPGHWFTILNYVNDHPDFEKKFEGKGKTYEDLEWDVKSYLILGGGLHDAAITAWSIKGYYDYIRPVSAIRYMAKNGQCSDPSLPSYSKDGIILYPGLIELVKRGDPLAGNRNQHVGKIKLFTWKGPNDILEPRINHAGVGWILAEEWWPYQRPSFVTPPFAGYISGHSTFSRAAAEILTALTGSAYFPGGLGSFMAKKDEFLVFENGPSTDIRLEWATYRDASDQCSLSRIWGGIHPPCDDLPGRIIGERIGINAFEFGKIYFNN